MTDEIERVREAHVAALREAYGEGIAAGDEFYRALAKRLQPKPTPPAPKVWSVSEGTARRLTNLVRARDDAAYSWEELTPTEREIDIAALNAIVDDILRDRPDAVAKEYQRRYRAAFGVGPSLKHLFPEVEG